MLLRIIAHSEAMRCSFWLSREWFITGNSPSSISSVKWWKTDTPQSLRTSQQVTFSFFFFFFWWGSSTSVYSEAIINHEFKDETRYLHRKITYFLESPPPCSVMLSFPHSRSLHTYSCNNFRCSNLGTVLKPGQLWDSISPMIWSIATGNQRKGPVKLYILCFHWSAPLVSCSNWSDRRTESDSGLGPYFLQLCDIWSQ